MMKISLGSGEVKLAGWVHVDCQVECRPDVCADLGVSLPFSSSSADYLQSEDFIGQLTFRQAGFFLSDCYRVLKPGGVLRLLTPDLEKLIELYRHRDQRLKDLWEREVRIPLVTGTLGEIVQKAITFANQQSFYDEETLRSLLEPIGFEVYKQSFNSSSFAELRNIDLRSPENAISLYLDCVRPAS